MTDTPLPLESAPSAAVKPERRAFRRTPLERPVMIETEIESTPAKVLNVSGGGIALETEVELPIGSEVGLYFELPIGYAVEARASVVRTDKSLIALRFLDLPHESLVAIRSFARISGLHRIDELPAK